MPVMPESRRKGSNTFVYVGMHPTMIFWLYSECEQAHYRISQLTQHLQVNVDEQKKQNQRLPPSTQNRSVFIVLLSLNTFGIHSNAGFNRSEDTGYRRKMRDV